jgi:quercetin dioxygenase-like cupin family protein
MGLGGLTVGTVRPDPASCGDQTAGRTMTKTADGIGKALVIAADAAPSFWQPVPANGFIRNILNQQTTGGAANFSLGTQTVAAQCFIREHTHPDNEEIIHIVEGRGIARIDGVEHAMATGTTVYVGRGVKHHFLNPNDQPMTFLWLMLPGGLDQFFSQIGRARVPGQPAPEPFPRPADIAAIEARTVFGWTDTSFDQQK